jgi:serine/threonine-protein kinase
VKLLRKPLRARRGAAARFLEEAALLAQLRHPGIVAVHGIGLLPDGGHFLVMDLVDGSDLGRQPCPSVAEALRWVAEAADALHHAHQQGIIHCDVKPSNLLLRSDGRVLVSDFGLACSLSNRGAFHGGTVGFMAPEATLPGVSVSPRTDVYGLGAVLRALLPNRPEEVEAICRRCLATEPEERYSSAAEVALAVRRVMTAK